MKKIKIILLSLIFGNMADAQSSYQNLYFVKEYEQTEFNKEDYQPGKKGFYIYRNCIYNLVLKNKLQLTSKVIDIMNDSIYYTLHINESAAYKNKERHDTLSLHPSQIRRIRLIGDRIMGLYSGHSLRNSKYVFEEANEPKRFDTRITRVYSADSSRYTPYELVPYLTAQGIDMLYEQCGVTYYFQGITEQDCPDTIQKILAKRKGVWFSPTNTSEVRGVNIGLQTMNLQDQPLTIKGVNLNADLLSLFVGMYGLLGITSGNTLINMPDTIHKTDIYNRIHGLSLSMGGLVGNNFIKGLSINGTICTATEMKGIVITGSQNIILEFRGITISALRNLSVRGAGLQVGLFNICKHLKGVQIGLWNVNSKRKLPFINWSF